jgi:hypothetical protein
MMPGFRHFLLRGCAVGDVSPSKRLLRRRHEPS